MSRVYDALIQGAKKSHSRSTVLESGTDQKNGLLGLSSRDIGLEWKITGTVATVIFIFGMLLIIIAHQFIGRALRTEIDQRTLAITTNLSNAAVGHVMSKNIIELYALLTKYARLNGWRTPSSKIARVRSLAIASGLSRDWSRHLRRQTKESK